MASPSRKRKAITIETKFEIIRCVEISEIPKKEVAVKFEIQPNTLSTILKNKAEIINYVTSDLNPSRKRHRNGKHDSVNSVRYKWFSVKMPQIFRSAGQIYTKSRKFHFQNWRL